MSFQKGKFVHLLATTTIHLGKLERNLSKDDVVEFDGFDLKIDGQTTSMPELKAGVKRGWLKIVDPASEIPTVEVEVEAPKITQKPKMKVQRVYDEERLVSEVEKKVAPPKKKFQVVVENQDNDIIPISKIKTNSGAKIASDIISSDIQGGEKVSTIKLQTSSKVKTVISDVSQASQEINKLDNLDTQIVTKTASKVEETEEEIDFDDLFEEESQLEDAQLLQAIDGEVQPDQGAVTIGKDESKVIALPVGIDWDMGVHWSKRANIAVEKYSTHPEILNAIIGVESKGVVKAINKAIEEDS
jgi:hypothetical protein